MCAFPAVCHSAISGLVSFAFHEELAGRRRFLSSVERYHWNVDVVSITVLRLSFANCDRAPHPVSGGGQKVVNIEDFSATLHEGRGSFNVIDRIPNLFRLIAASLTRAAAAGR